ncbi:MAG: bifunctional glutamate N-acetyltransferase/amino-acid acetyltransferase ArgJ [Gammaproteobacteria bacterium]
MAVGLQHLPELLPVEGVRLGTARAGIKYAGRRDLVLVELRPGAACAAVFTRNAFCAAPVQLAREHLRVCAPRYLLINTGNANAGTGAVGLRDARTCCTAVARIADCGAEEVLPFSTGVIGEPLPVAAIEAGLPAAFDALDAGGWADAAQGIMTTDTVPKGISRQIEIDGHTVTVTGIAKGSGMIRPDMATMLAFIATDASVAPDLLQRCLQQAVQRSFNRVTVDGDTSTNDACVLMATGGSPLPSMDREGPAYEALCEALAEVCEYLAQALIRDGEGASKFVTVDVAGGRDAEECLSVAYTVAHSPLVKTALFASDPNWGRILAAVGRAGLHELNLERVAIHLDDVCIVRDGGRAADYTEALGQEVMGREEITIFIELGRGIARERVWTCDLSYDYVRINAEYRT